jgi:hypothetical protein
MVPREVIMGLDKIERGVSFVAAAIALLLAAIEVPHLLKNTYVKDTLNKAKSKPYCTKPYHLVANMCQHMRLTHPSAWWPQFLEIIIFAGAIIIFALIHKRVGVVVASLILWLALSATGLPFLFVAGWLMVRAFRLQKWGDPTFSGSNRAAREQAKARKEGREVTPRAPRRAKGSKASTEPVVTRPAAPPAPSKRYTPKQKPRKR